VEYETKVRRAMRIREKSVIQPSWEWCLDKDVPRAIKSKCPRNCGAKDESPMETNGSIDTGLNKCKGRGGLRDLMERIRASPRKIRKDI
jgi:hypothetical protein